MGFLEVLAIAVALSLDAFAVAAATGSSVRALHAGMFVRMAGAFGFFQFMMPVIGWYLGSSVHAFIESWDHWIAFVLLLWVGGSMIRAGFSAEMEKGEAESCPEEVPVATHGSLQFKTLMVLAVATSLDALAVGLSFSMLELAIWWPAIIIGVVCAAISSAGLVLGARLAGATTLGNKAGIVGGVVLVGIGLQILYQHGVFGS